MQAIVWNMAHKVASWNVLESLEADLALLCECRVPKGFSSNVIGGGATQGLDGYKRPWATAVVSQDHDFREIHDARANRRGRQINIPFVNSRPGSWTAAVASIPDFGDVTAVTLYGLMDEKSDASLHRSLSELAPLLDDPRYNQLLLLGGDLNTWTGWKPGSHLNRDLVVLDRIRAFGLEDCLELRRPDGPLAGCPCSFGEACKHTRTRLDPRYPHIPYQMDYLFASHAMADRLLTCEARPHESMASPSDHFPIVATFEP